MNKIVFENRNRTIVILMLCVLTGCATFLEGTAQEIRIATTPPGATCSLLRSGLTIGTVQSTPGSVMVSKTKDNITIKCSKQGYEDAIYFNESGMAATSFGNTLFAGTLGLGIPIIVDSATGADNKYDPDVSIPMVAKAEKAPVSGAAPSGQ